MNMRESVINSAIRSFDQCAPEVLRSLRLVFIDQLLRSEGFDQLLSRDEIEEVNAAVERGELPYLGCSGDSCRTCEG